MKCKVVGMIGAALSLAITGVVGNQLASFAAPQPRLSQLDNPSAPVTEAPLTYKLETYKSRVIRGKRTYGVALPPDYDENPNQRYPVIFLLHGGHGTPTAWFEKDKGAALTTLQQLYAEGKLPPSIIITPDGYDQRGTSAYRDPEYLDGPNGKIATGIGNELVSVIQSRYRTLPAPNFWAIGGLSSGAWGAMNIGLHYPNHFSILFSHSGYFRHKSGSQNSPISLVKRLNPEQRRKLRIYLDTGETDSFYLKENQQFSTVLNRLGIKNVFHEFPGEHTWRYWREHLADSLSFVGEQFQQAQQAKPSSSNLSTP
ncbi:MAG TPA: alpha/beta hydrolase-fold protein [Waterburya sp.]